MALRPKTTTQLKLSEEQVLKIRESYFRYGVSMYDLSDIYGVSKALIQKAVHGLERFQHIKDDIPSDIKEKREPIKSRRKRQQAEAKTSYHAYMSKPLNTITRQKNREYQKNYRAKQREAEELAQKGITTAYHPNYNNLPSSDIYGNKLCKYCLKYGDDCQCENN